MLWFLAVCVAVVSAQNAPTPAPRRCCTPNTWSARLGSSAGTFKNHIPGTEYRETMMYYDFGNQRSAFDEVTFYGDGTLRSRRFVNLHRGRHGFLVEDNECMVFEIGVMERACISENAEFRRNITWGLGAGKNMTLSEWVAPIKDGDRTIGGHGLLWTATGCFPVGVSSAFQFFDEREREFIAELEGLSVHDIMGTITNPDAFRLPSSCERPTPIELDDTRLMRYNLIHEVLL